MTKDDWIKLAMPAAISLLAVAVLAAPVMVKAQLSDNGTVWVKQYGAWDMNCK